MENVFFSVVNAAAAAATGGGGCVADAGSAHLIVCVPFVLLSSSFSCLLLPLCLLHLCVQHEIDSNKNNNKNLLSYSN